VTTQQVLTPAGVTAVLGGAVSSVVFVSGQEIFAANGGNVSRISTSDNRVLGSAALGVRPGFQGLRVDPKTGAVWIASTVSGRDSKNRAEPVHLMRWTGTQFEIVASELGNYSSGQTGIATELNGNGLRPIAVPLPAGNAVAVVDAESGSYAGRVATGQAPFAAEVSRDGKIAWVSNWGGRFAAAGEATAGSLKVLVDARGIASSGTVTEVDLEKLSVHRQVEVGLHPTAIVWQEEAHRLYVANSNSDSVSVVDTEQGSVAATWTLSLGGRSEIGLSPSALALSADGKRLFVACAGVNAIAVVETNGGQVLGWIPTAWYPTSLALSPDGTHLACGALLGAGTGGNDARRRSIWVKRGAVSLIPIPDETQLRDYSRAVLVNHRLSPETAAATPAGECKSQSPIPACPGDVPPIEHVVLIIKENRTYDQVLGDLGRGNRDVSLSMYPGHVAPNHHRLADQFVVLDNFYATGGVSAEGHLWLTQAYAPSYAIWPGYAGRSYPFDGTDPLAYSPKGFLWDLAKAAGKSVRVYGEFVPSMSAPEDRTRLLQEWADGADFEGRWNVKAQVPGLDEVLARQYPSFALSIPDVVRAQLFLKDLERWKQAGSMPNLVIVQLPCDHTLGTSPGASAPYAMVADNDLALGQMVEALSRSPFWPKMAIFVTEDDAQDGVDHVDGHRTVTLLASPYAKRWRTDSTFYSHQSILKTIELILGLPTLSMFDLIATDMRAAFTSEPDLAPYEADTPSVSLFDTNPAASALRGQARKDAIASSRMNWHVPDDVPSEQLNRILWRQAKGLKAAYPQRRQGALLPQIVARDGDDEK
jgi:YVTN family beta-propeller protein